MIVRYVCNGCKAVTWSAYALSGLPHLVCPKCGGGSWRAAETVHEVGEAATLEDGVYHLEWVDDNHVRLTRSRGEGARNERREN